MDKPLVSICIPTRNTERWLRQAIDSALNQTWSPLEVIVIDDGSTDGTVNMLKSYGDRIQWRSTKPQGGNPARNLGLSVAKGEWIQFLDADDYLLPEKITAQFEQAGADTDVDLILSPELIERWAGQYPLGLEAKPIPTDEDLFRQWLAWELPGTHGGLWRKKSLLAVGAWNEEMPCCQDYELYARALKQGLKMKWTAKPLNVYRIWSEGTVCRRDPLELIQVKARLMDEMIDWLKERGEWTPSRNIAAGQGFFEMSRRLALVNEAVAWTFHDEKKNRGLIHLAGAAAPLHYRLFYSLIGFKRTEQLARRVR